LKLSIEREKIARKTKRMINSSFLNMERLTNL
jgi:hypothetical protein